MKFFFKTIKVFIIINIIVLIASIGLGYYAYKDTINNTAIDRIIAVTQQDPSYTALRDISPVFLASIVAIEDHRFYEHGGLDILSVTRAAATNVLKRNISQGGSTITQQLAKNLFLTHQKTMSRKIKELFLAHALEKRYTKENILELYVNVIYYGDGNTGIQAASQDYFQKAPIDLSYDEATLLAGLPQSPSRYALSSNLEVAKNRQKQVIEALENFSNFSPTGDSYVYER